MVGAVKKRILGMTVLGAVAGVLSLGASSASANSIEITGGSVYLTNPTVTPNGPNFDWTYTLNVSGSATVVQGDFFVIVDFAGLVGTGTLGDGLWSFSIAPLLGPGTAIAPYSSTTGLSSTVYAETDGSGGPDTSSLASSATDSPGLFDLILVRTGVTPINSNGSLLSFTFTSTTNVAKATPGFLLARDFGNGGFSETNNASAIVPDPAVGSGPVPLPAIASMGMSMFGLLGAGLLGRKLTRKASVA